MFVAIICFKSRAGVVNKAVIKNTLTSTHNNLASQLSHTPTQGPTILYLSRFVCVYVCIYMYIYAHILYIDIANIYKYLFACDIICDKDDHN